MEPSRAGRGALALDASARPWIADALLGITVTLVIALIIATSSGGEREPDALAYLFAVGFGAVLLLRRTMPSSVVVLSVLGMFAYYTLHYPPIGVAVPLVAALFSAAEAGLTWWAVGGAAVAYVVSLYYRVRDGQEPIGFVVGYESVSNLALFAAAIALGYGLRARRVRAAQQAEIARLTAAQLAREADLRIQSERERISRELHDTVGHTMSVISLQAGVGAEAVGRDDRVAAEALELIRAASRRTLRELRSMVRILRSDADRDETRSVPSLSAVQELVDTARGTGLEVTSSITASPQQLSPSVDAAAYRVIQESITNVVRHAGATRAHVRADVRSDRLHVSVTDNGRGLDGGAGEGFGMAGMTERVRLLGGRLVTRSPASGGFAVEATMPTRIDS